MYPVGGAVLVVGILLIIWLSTLSYFFWKEKKFLDQLFPKTKEDLKDESALIFRSRLEELIRAVEESGRKSQILSKNLIGVRKEGLSHVQNLAMIRYNPYNDTGGDQSFSAVLLDGKENGLLLTSLHSRAGTRIYIKNILEGKSDIELSKEERQVLEKIIGENE